MSLASIVKAFLFVIELLVLLVCVALGARTGGLAVGLYGGLGVALYCFFFQMDAGAIPYDVMMIIMACVTAVGTLQAAGGLDYVVYLCERLLRSRPSWILFLAPFVTFLLTVLAGTGHTTYSALPVIIEVSKDNGIKPKLPLSVAVIASQLAVCASPISAAIAWLNDAVKKEEQYDFGYLHLLGVLIPACFIATMVTAVIMSFKNRSLYDDPVFVQRVARGDCKIRTALPDETMELIKQIRLEAAERDKLEGKDSVPSYQLMINSHSFTSVSPALEENNTFAFLPSELAADRSKVPRGARRSCLIFLVGVFFIVGYSIALSPNILPQWREEDKHIRSSDAVVIIFLTVAACILHFAHVNPAHIALQPTFRSGLNGCICVLGVAWMGNTFMDNQIDHIQNISGDIFSVAPWLFPLIAMIASILLYSQASTLMALWPMGFELNINGVTMVASVPATAALFVLPTYPTLLTAVEMDDTGSTKLGRYVFDHSFVVPGFISVILSVALAYAFGAAIL